MVDKKRKRDDSGDGRTPAVGTLAISPAARSSLSASTKKAKIASYAPSIKSSLGNVITPPVKTPDFMVVKLARPSSSCDAASSSLSGKSSLVLPIRKEGRTSLGNVILPPKANNPLRDEDMRGWPEDRMQENTGSALVDLVTAPRKNNATEDMGDEEMGESGGMPQPLRGISKATKDLGVLVPQMTSTLAGRTAGLKGSEGSLTSFLSSGTSSVSSPRDQQVLIVLDAANICLKHSYPVQLNAGDCAPLSRSVKILPAVVSFWEALGATVKAFLPEAWIHQLREQQEEAAMIKTLSAEGVLAVTPSKENDDNYILAYAQSHGGYIVSNDQYRDHVWNEEDPGSKAALRRFLSERRISFTFLGEEFLPNPQIMAQLVLRRQRTVTR